MEGVIRVNTGREVIYFDENGSRITTAQQLRQDILEIVERPDAEAKVNNFFKKFAIPSSISLGAMNVANYAFAAGDTIGNRLKPLLSIVQDLALPVGIIVASWGLIEIIMGNFPSGKEKIKYALLGFVGMFVIPEIFYTIRDAFKIS